MNVHESWGVCQIKLEYYMKGTAKNSQQKDNEVLLVEHRVIKYVDIYNSINKILITTNFFYIPLGHYQYMKSG